MPDPDPALDVTARKDSLGLAELLAMGIGGMIGGGIFSILGLAVDVAGHAAPLAFVVGACVAALAGYSYVRLALSFHSDGASFTYLERAFPRHPNVAGIAGWTIIIGYVGTLALYAFTFGAYADHLLGGAQALRPMLSVGALLFFTLLNLRGASVSGRAEDLIVGTKVILLGIFVVAALPYVQRDNLTPVFDKGPTSPIIAGALVFVAFEGFQLITNAVVETRKPDRNLPLGIYGSIGITSLIYIGVAIVALGNLGAQGLVDAEEYALAAAAKPALGHAGTVLIDIAAMLATASAINATLFGAARLLAEMATEHRVPAAFSHRSHTDVPWLAVVTITVLALLLTALGSLEVIATFSSLVFLLVSTGVAVANGRLRATTHANMAVVGASIVLMLAAIGLLIQHLATHEPTTLGVIAALFIVVAGAELLFFKRSGATSSG